MKFDADLNTVETGVWTEFDGSKFLVAHIGSMKFQRELQRLQLPHARKLREGTLDPQINKAILCQAMASGLVLDWSEVTNNAGEIAPYTPKNCQTALMRNPEFRDYISEFATLLSNFKTEEVETLGNVSSTG